MDVVTGSLVSTGIWVSSVMDVMTGIWSARGMSVITGA